jgi:hypothetical protein
MIMHQFESVIQDDGVIVLPRHMSKLKQHRVKLTLVDLEPVNENPVTFLSNIIKNYAAIDEEDLDIDGIYGNREKHNDRGIVFD